MVPKMSNNSGYPRERLVASAYAQAGYIVERNRFLGADRSLEIDLVASRYTPWAIHTLVGVTGGSRSPNLHARDVHARRDLLGLDRGVSITRHPVSSSEIAARLEMRGTTLFAIEDDADIVDRLAAGGECPGAVPSLAELWVAAFEVIDVFRATVRKLPISTDEAFHEIGKEIKDREQEIETVLWLREDQLDRAQALRRLEISQARSLAQRAADVLHPQGEYRHRAFEAFRKPELLPFHATVHVQLVERLLAARTFVELALSASGDPSLRADLERVLFVGPRVVGLLDRLDEAAYLPSVLQTFFLVLGGFIWTPGRERELEFLGQTAGCDARTAEAVLYEIFPMVLPFSFVRPDWWRSVSGKQTVMAHKFFPTPLHGAGVVARSVIHAGDRRWCETWAPPEWKQAFEFARSQLCDPEGSVAKRDRRSRGLPAASGRAGNTIPG